MTDFLSLTSNERVDLADLSFACFDSQFAAQRLLPAQMLTNPANPQMWVLSGFLATNPSAMLVTVARGVALLCYRNGATLNYGTICAEGDATKTLDASTLSLGTYTLYIAFQTVPTAQASRAVWNPATATESAVSQSTRVSANWTLRAELSNPGAEYLPIATLVVAQGSVTLSDLRPFYFEGALVNSFGQTWGSGANDRANDRATYGVHDLRTFVDAMRTCLEDIKGPGLARWYSNMVAGQTIGFAGTPVLGRTQWFDSNFYAQGSTTAPSINWGVGAAQTYTRSTNQFSTVAPGGSNSWAPTLGFTSTNPSTTAPAQCAYTAIVGTAAGATFGAANQMAVTGYAGSITGAYVMSQNGLNVLTNTSILAGYFTPGGSLSLGAGTSPASVLHTRSNGTAAAITFDAGTSTSQFQLLPGTTVGSDNANGLVWRDTTSGATFMRYTRSTGNIDYPGGNGPLLQASSQPVKISGVAGVTMPVNPWGVVAAGTLVYNLTSYYGSAAGPVVIAPNGAGIAAIYLPVHLPYACTIQALGYNVGRIRNTQTASTAAATYAIGLYSTNKSVTPYASTSFSTAAYTPTQSNTIGNSVSPNNVYLPFTYTQDNNATFGESFYISIVASNLQSTDYLTINNQAIFLVCTSIGMCIAG